MSLYPEPDGFSKNKQKMNYICQIMQQNLEKKKIHSRFIVEFRRVSFIRSM